MAFDPLAPAPRLPEDLTVVSGYVEPVGGLEAVLTASPGGDVVQVPLLQTRTPLKWASTFSRAVYKRDIVGRFPDAASAQAAIQPVLERFSRDPSLPPQAPGGRE